MYVNVKCVIINQLIIQMRNCSSLMTLPLSHPLNVWPESVCISVILLFTCSSTALLRDETLPIKVEDSSCVLTPPPTRNRI